MRNDDIYAIQPFDLSPLEYKDIDLDILEIEINEYSHNRMSGTKVNIYPNHPYNSKLNVNTIDHQIDHVLFRVNVGIYCNVNISPEEKLDLIDYIYNKSPNNIYIQKMKLAAYFKGDK